MKMRLTEDLKSTRWIYAKGILFALLSVLAAALLIARAPRLDVVFLLLVCVWASCRAYYLAFYVIQHYVDGDFRYSGLLDFARYSLARRGTNDNSESDRGEDDSPR